MVSPIRLIRLALLTSPLVTSCATRLTPGQQATAHLTEQEQKWDKQHKMFLENPERKSKNYINAEVLKETNAENSSVRIGLKDQRGVLLRNGKDIAMDFRVSTGRSSHPTPKGDFKIIEKDKDHRSSKYGSYVGADGDTVEGNVNAYVDPKPEGASYVGATMPYFCRITGDGVGLHIGYVPQYPASHGCIRVQGAVMPSLYNVVKVGTPVTVTDHAIPQAPVAAEAVTKAAPAKKSWFHRATPVTTPNPQEPAEG